MVVSISNLYSFEICIIYNILRYGFVLHGHFKDHLSIKTPANIPPKAEKRKQKNASIERTALFF